MLPIKFVKDNIIIDAMQEYVGKSYECKHALAKNFFINQ